AEAVNTACYVQNRVLVTKPYNKTHYELLLGRPPSISFMRPFGCHVTILNTLDPLGKFDGNADEGFFVGYYINSKAFRVFNTRTRKVEENLHITFLKNKPNVAGNEPDWLFDIDLLTNSMNYKPVTTRNQTNKNAGIKDTQQNILLPLLYDSLQSLKDAVADDAGKKTNEEPANEGERNGQEKEGGASNKEDDQNVQNFRVTLDNLLAQQKKGYANSTNRDSIVSPSIITTRQSFTNANDLPTDPLMPDLEDTDDLLNTSIFSGAYNDEDIGVKADLNNLETTMNVSPIPTTRIHKDHPKDQIIRDINSATQTRRMTKIFEELAMMDVKSSFLYGTIEEEVYVCQPHGFEDPQFPDKVYKVEKALYGLHQDPKAWYNIIFGSTKKSLCVEFESLMHKKFQMSSMGELTFFLGLQVMQRDDGIFISQDKYVADILKKFNFVTMKIASTLIETHKALLKDEEAEGVDVHLYRSMIRSLMYLIASRPNIMFAVCACARFQVTPKVSHLHAMKRIFRYLKASLDRKSIIRGCQFLSKRLISWQCKKQNIVANSTTEAEYVAAASCYGQSRMDGRTCNIKQKCVKSQIPKRGQYTKIPQSGGPPEKVGHEAVHKELGDRIERAATTSSSLEAEQDSGSGPRIGVDTARHKLNTASINTSENGEMEITATIDGRVKTVTEASIRRHLKLEDSDGISTLPNTEIFKQLALMGAPSTSQPLTLPPSMKTTYVAEEAATMPHDSPLSRVHSLGSDEGSITLHELMVLCTTLSKKVESLESNLKQTKLTYGAAYTKLIMKVNKLENIIKSSKARRRVRLIVSEDEDDLEDPSK
ncbi:putative ribonuclease H-like domain-containing protein, partial [Tanacetum coccineum]